MNGVRQPRGIRFQLLVWVNVVLSGAILLFLVFDYQRELRAQMNDKHVALQEEAQTLAQAVRLLHHHGRDTVQNYIDAVCGRMREQQSPGHHIAVRVPEGILQATAHHRASPELVAAMQEAAQNDDYRARFSDHELIVGTFSDAVLAVWVSEYVTNIRASLHAIYWYRLLAIVGLGFLAAAIVDAVLLHVAVRPMRRLVNTVRRIGAGEFGVQTAGFRSAEHAYLGQAINEMSQRLDEVETQRQRAMNRAQRIQQNLLPKTCDAPCATIAASYQPAEDVAGDYYDVIHLPDKSCLFCVADVTGHGVPAALGATMLKTLLLHATEHHTAPSEVLAFINERYTGIALPGDFVSMVVARWDARHAILECASAGHPPALLLTGDELRELGAGGLLIGVDETAQFQSDRVPVAAHDRLLLISDGAIEAFDAHKAMFGRDRLAQLFAESRHRPIQESLEEITQALARHQGNLPPTDDITLLAIEFLG